MSSIAGRSEYVRFAPEVRGWAALRLAVLVPASVHREIENLLCRHTSKPSVEGGLAARAVNPRANEALVGRALHAVSGPAAIAWCREVSERWPVLGPAAGSACIARLWAVRLLEPGGGIEEGWPEAVDCVWSVVRPILARVGVEVQGGQREELRHEVAAPLALMFLKSLAAGRKDLRLLGDGSADRADGPPFGWAPGIDSAGAVIRYLGAGQVPGGFQSHALLSSPLARLLREAGLAAALATVRWWCGRCGTWLDYDAGRCPHCGEGLAVRHGQRLVARRVLDRHAAVGLRPHAAFGQASAWSDGDAGRLDDGIDAAAARKECLRRARRLWQRIIVGRRASVAARVVLGALAGAEPLARVADSPRPRRPWLERLVEVLAEERLDRVPLALRAGAAAVTVAARMGRPVPQILASHVGVLATRFRHAVFGMARNAMK
jgi:hypothetical protein